MEILKQDLNKNGKQKSGTDKYFDYNNDSRIYQNAPNPFSKDTEIKQNHRLFLKKLLLNHILYLKNLNQ